MADRSEDEPTELLLKALRHPLRRELLRIYFEATEPLGPKELAQATGRPLSSVSYHVRELARCQVIEFVEEEKRRGSVAHFYEATARVRGTSWARDALTLPSEQKESDTEARPTTDDNEASTRS